eukprot:4401718-Amphidinium_carterae.1
MCPAFVNTQRPLFDYQATTGVVTYNQEIRVAHIVLVSMRVHRTFCDGDCQVRLLDALWLHLSCLVRGLQELRPILLIAGKGDSVPSSGIASKGEATDV